VGFVLAAADPATLSVVVGSLVARRLAVPVPVVLVLAGLGYALLPGPNVELDPDVVLVVVIPLRLQRELDHEERLLSRDQPG
jgi:hypothetical protein